MKTTSRFALATVAGLLLGTTALTPAYAADLGGDCCADLEERVAELEATTARKGNKKVSLEISGQVNRALLAFDSEEFDASDAYVVDNAYSSSRFRFVGKAKMKPGWNAGFLIELQVNDTASSSVDQFDDEGTNNDTTLSTRHASWYIESEKLGRVTLGQTSSVTDDIILISLADTVGFATADTLYVTEFETGAGITYGDLTGNWGSSSVNLDTNRGDFVRYDTPSIYGFILSAAWGENDVFDIGVRFKKEWNSFRIAAGVGYYWNGDDPLGDLASENSVEEIKGSASVMHVPTGLFVHFAALERQVEGLDTDQDEATMYYIQAGIEKKFTSYGATTIFGEYGEYSDFAIIDDAESSDVTRWGFGLAQTFDSAALQLYGTVQFYTDGEVDGEEIEDLTIGVVGARIKF